MDTEFDPTDFLETVEESFVQQTTVTVPKWRTYEPEHKKNWTIFSPVLTEYYRIIDNPKRLPTILHSLISKERAFTFGGNRPSYHNFKFYVPDEYGVTRRLYFNVCHENFVVGAFGATLIGLSTRYYMPSAGRLHKFVSQKMLLGQPASAISKMVVTGSMMTVGFCWKMVHRAVVGGILYDTLRRSRDEKQNNHAHWLNAGMAGGLCGLIFGIHGGLPHAWLAAAVSSGGAMMSEFVPTFEKDSKKT